MTKPDDRTNTLPLSGVRVLDFSRLLPGPFATQMLGELGADVIKVEQPDIGDPSRHNHPQFKTNSVYFNAVNANKRSIAVDLKQAPGRELIERLLAHADVVIESFRPGVAKKLGIDYASCKRANARIVYCSITGFGQSGPLSHIAGHDLVIQGMTGLMGCALGEQNPPAVPGFQAADFAGSLYAVIAVQAALAQREKTGVGCEVDLAMFEALFHMCLLPLSSRLAQSAGYSGEPRMESFGGNPRYSTYLSKDGKPVAVSLLEARAWREFCEAIGRADLVSEDETPEHRLSAHGERHGLYRTALTEWCGSHTWEEIMRHVDETGIAICPVCTPGEALALPHVAARNMVGHIDHPIEGRIPYLTSPLARAGLAREIPHPAPDLGEQTRDILGELGYTEAETGDLFAENVVVSHARSEGVERRLK
jgi:crotonobetainyl-CoA:carnitine CoA-transferase CaiB-like acyl-CoA transferase